MDFDVNQYISELLKDAQNLPKEQVEAAKAVLANPAVAARVKDTALMRSDYSRNMDRLRDEQKAAEELRKALDTQKAEVERFYQSQITADHNNQEAFTRLQEDNKKLRAAVAGGEPYHLDGGGDGTPSPSNNTNFLTKDEWDKRERQLQEQSLRLMAKTNFLSLQHFKEFGEVLDVEKWQEHAIKTGLPLDVAYKSFTEELRKKKDAEEWQKKLDAAKQEGAMEYASRHNLPLVDTHPRGIHALKAENDVPKTSSDRVKAATEAYMRGQ